jgi:hypothetical protein
MYEFLNLIEKGHISLAIFFFTFLPPILCEFAVSLFALYSSLIFCILFIRN